MDPLHPLAGTLLPSAHAQRQASADNQRQVRRAQALAKNVAAPGDRVDVEHEVESTEGPTAVGDEPPREQGHPPRRDPRDDQSSGRDESDDRPRIDLTA